MNIAKTIKDLYVLQLGTHDSNYTTETHLCPEEEDSRLAVENTGKSILCIQLYRPVVHWSMVGILELLLPRDTSIRSLGALVQG